MPGRGREIAIRFLLFRDVGGPILEPMKRFRTTPVQLALPFTATSLQRIDPARHMARFYSLEVEQDLFGRVVVVRRWGRIGTAGRTRMDEHPDEGRAVAALVKLEASKQRRGYLKTASGFK